MLALYEQRPREALHLFAGSLELARQINLHINIAYSLGGLGCALAALGELTSSARLLGAAEALHERLGAPIEPYAGQAYADGSAPVRRRLGLSELAVAWAEGQTLSETDAATSALKTVADLAPL